MANRPVFILNNSAPYFRKIDIEFEYASGFALVQKQKNINNLHKDFLTLYPNHKILEVSTKSPDILGIQLSAFNLELSINYQKYPVEILYQASKVYNSDIDNNIILKMQPNEAKNFLKEINDKYTLKEFIFNGISFPLEPKTYFYNWLYINALMRNKELIQEILDCGYNAFTDIEYNPKKSINCQAQALAIGISLIKNKQIFDLYNNNFIDHIAFLNTVYQGFTHYSYSTIDLTDL